MDVGPLTTGVVGELQPRLAGRDLALNVAVDASLPMVLGNRDQLERVLFNLVGNALKFTPDGGRVEVAACERDGAVVLEVHDTGIGIPGEELDRLFERFYRASTATAQAIPGTGLGLAITHLLVAHHGGSITARSTPGEGTTFTVTLPPAGVADHAPASPTHATTGSP